MYVPPAVAISRLPNGSSKGGRANSNYTEAQLNLMVTYNDLGVHKARRYRQRCGARFPVIDCTRRSARPIKRA
jgi:hypothetical protein